MNFYHDKTETAIIISAMLILSIEVVSEDGVATGAMRQAADRLMEQDLVIDILIKAINETLTDNLHLADGETCALIKLKNAFEQLNIAHECI